MNKDELMKQLIQKKNLFEKKSNHKTQSIIKQYGKIQGSLNNETKKLAGEIKTLIVKLMIANDMGKFVSNNSLNANKLNMVITKGKTIEEVYNNRKKIEKAVEKKKKSETEQIIKLKAEIDKKLKAIESRKKSQ